MTKWVVRGLKTGIKTTHYPAEPETAAGVSPGRPCGTSAQRAGNGAALVSTCPTDALFGEQRGVSVDYTRCVHCFRCRHEEDRGGMAWEDTYEWAGYPSEAASIRHKLGKAFGRSLHIRFVDAGACGACMGEARSLNNPYYNMHRLGFFVTPTPRNADILLVAGPVTDAMRLPLRKTYEAMPTPKRVVAMGVCALSGGVFGPSFASGAGVAEVISVDVVVPGCPPPPLAILHGLLLAVERKPPAPLTSHSPMPG